MSKLTDSMCWVVLQRTPERIGSPSVWIAKEVYNNKQSAYLKATSYGVSNLNGLPFGMVKELPCK